MSPATRKYSYHGTFGPDFNRESYERSVVFHGGQGVFNRNEESNLVLYCASDESVSMQVIGKLARPRMRMPMQHIVQKSEVQKNPAKPHFLQFASDEATYSSDSDEASETKVEAVSPVLFET